MAVLVAATMCALGANAAEAYACYTYWNKTLTFYYDDQRDSQMTTTYDLNTGENDPGWYTDDTKSSVYKVVFDSSFANARPKSTFRWFHQMHDLQSVTGLGYLNTSEVTTMRQMFAECAALTSLNDIHFNTSKVTDMSWMFDNCWVLPRLDLSSFNTSKVTNMYGMFHTCKILQTIYVGSGWTTAAVTTSNMMFSGSTSLKGGKGTTYDVNHVDKAYAHIDGGPSNPGYLTDKNAPVAYACYTSSNTTLTFYYDNQRENRSGKTYDLNTDNGIPRWKADAYNPDVTNVVFQPSFADARPTSTYEWFDGMEKLQTITGLSYLNTSEVTNMASMFEDCTKLTILDLSTFNTSKVTTMESMFRNCGSLSTIFVAEGWSTAAVTTSYNMFYKCPYLRGGQGTTYNVNHTDKTYAHIDGGPSNPGYFTDKNAPVAYACYTPTNRTLTFYYDNQRLTRQGTKYDLNTGNGIPGWKADAYNSYVAKVVFDSSFADARPTSTYEWFDGMEKLQTITGLSYLNTSEVTNMASMFEDCTKLTILDLSTFNTSKVTTMESMFRNCGSLSTIFVAEGWSTAAVTTSYNMFYKCPYLRGGQGTTYNVNHTDKTYAHIDGGPSNPGYFTDKNAPVAYACYTPTNRTLTFYYDNQRLTRQGTKYDLNTGNGIPGWKADAYNSYVAKVVFDSSFADARPTSTYQWFDGMSRIQTIPDMSCLNTSEVTNMASMFEDCTQLTSLDLSTFNTSKVKDMEDMFRNCSSLSTIYVAEGWSTAAVTTSYNMFYQCTNLRGGKGTTYNVNHTDKAYAHIDGGPGNPGYFTDISEAVATSIEAFPAKTTTVKGIYTLDGRKLNELPTKKGVYIVDGKKVVVK